MVNSFLEKAQSWSENHALNPELQRFCDFLAERYQGIDWVINFSEQQSFSLEVLNQKTEHFEQSNIHQIDIEVFIGHRSASASVLGTSFDDWVQTAAQAVEMAKRAQEDRWLSFPQRELFDCNIKSSHHLAQPYDLTAQELQGYLLAFEQEALRLDALGLVRSDGASFSGHYVRHSYCNSAGLHLMTPSTSFHQSLSLIAQDHQSQESDYISDSSCRFQALEPVTALAKKVFERTTSKLGKRKIPSGTYPVIFSPRCSLGLLRCLLKALSGRLQYLKSSYLHGALGAQVLPLWASLWDEPRALDRDRYAVIDSDGLPTQNHHIILDGVLQQFLVSHYSAKRLGVKPCGLASGLINTSLTTNAASLEELVGGYGECVVVDSVSGTGINLMHGDYSQGIEGFYYKNGVRQHAIEEATIAANLKELFLSLDGHAADFIRPSGARVGSLAFPAMAVSCR